MDEPETGSDGVGVEIDQRGDEVLANLVRAANKDFEMGITLAVGGLLVTGILVGPRRWLDGLLAELREGNDGLAAFADGLDEGLGAAFAQHDRELDGDDWKYVEIAFVHLRDARFVQPGASPIPENRPVVWRGLFESVDGWCLGTFS